MEETPNLSKIDSKALLLFLGILDITLFFILFSGQQNFSLLATTLLLVIFICGISFLLLAGSADSNIISIKKPSRLMVLLAFLSAISIMYELYFDLQSNSGVFEAIAKNLLIVIAAAMPIVAIYFIGKKFGTVEFGGLYRSSAFKIFIILVIVSIITSYVVMSALQNNNWKGTDEIAFDYYASHLVVNGTNPYTADMKPALTQFGLDPTLRLDSSCECQYGYPALSFVPFTILPLLGVNNYYPYPFVFVTVLCVILAAFAVYYYSDKNISVLLLLFFFTILAYLFNPAGNTKYLAVSVFLLFAYLERSRLYLHSVLLGLAASAHQLAWVAIPFFYVLTLSTYGKGRLFRSVLISFAVFLLINSYFIAISPQATISNLFVFGDKLVFIGPNLMQLLLTFYPVPYWFSTLMLALFYTAFLVLFYFYTGTLRTLLALVPATILFFAWVNDLVYFLAFVPILVAIHYVDREKIQDKLENSSLIKYTVAFLAVVLVSVLFYADTSYIRANTLAINSVFFTLNVGHTSSTTSLYSLDVNVTNNGNNTENLLFHVVSRNPNHDAYLVGVPAYTIPPLTSRNFSLLYNLNHVNKDTSIYVYVLSNDYIQGSEYVIQSLR